MVLTYNRVVSNHWLRAPEHCESKDRKKESVINCGITKVL